MQTNAARGKPKAKATDLSVSLKDEGATTLATAYTNFTSILKTKILGQKTASVCLANSHATAAVNYKVLVSNDPEGASASYVEEKASAAVSAMAGAAHVINGPFAWVDVQIQSVGADSPQSSVWLLAVDT